MFNQVFESLQVKNIYQIPCEFKKSALENNFLEEDYIYTAMKVN